MERPRVRDKATGRDGGFLYVVQCLIDGAAQLSRFPRSAEENPGQFNPRHPSNFRISSAWMKRATWAGGLRFPAPILPGQGCQFQALNLSRRPLRQFVEQKDAIGTLEFA